MRGGRKTWVILIACCALAGLQVTAWALNPPIVEITSGPDDPTNSTVADFTFTVDDPGADVECSLDGEAFADCTSPQMRTIAAAEGSHSFIVQATDAGAMVGSDTYTWAYDETAPTATIDPPTPADPSNDTDPEFSFSSDDPTATFECQLDGAGFSPCTSGDTFPVTGEGSHTFEVQATDDAGNTGPADSFTWELDTVAPTATIDPPTPADPSSDTDPEFFFSSDEDPNATFECQLDGAGFSPCTSGDTFPVTGEGSHTFEVQATDPAGNTGPADSFTWELDTTAPVVEITSGPDDPTNSTTADFTFTVDDPTADVECSLDGESFADCTSPQMRTITATEGNHTFTVRATDDATNQGSDTHNWVYDATAPTVEITSGPDDPTNSTTADFTFTVDDPGADVECSLDGEAFTDCTSPQMRTIAPTEGTHTFTVRATDDATNQGSDTHTWVYDATAPTVVITAQPPAISTSRSAHFEFAVDDPTADAECKLDTGGFVGCDSDSGHDYSALADGTHTFTVRAIDPAGNESAHDSYTWLIDATGPTVSIDEAPDPASRDTTPRFEFSTEPNADFECRLDSSVEAEYESCASGVETPILDDGTHKFEVRGIDEFGNVGSPTAHTWDVDTAGPTVTVDSGPPDPSNSTIAVFGFTAADPHPVQVRCSLNNGPFVPCDSSSVHEYGGLGEATYSFRVRATDAANNTTISAAYTWTIDLTVPMTSIGTGPASITTLSDASFSFGSEPGATLHCSLDGGGFQPCSSPVTYRGLDAGGHVFQALAVDAASNTGPPASYSWTITSGSSQPPTVLRGVPPAAGTAGRRCGGKKKKAKKSKKCGRGKKGKKR